MDLGCDECGQEFKTCLDHYINPEMLLPDRSGDYEVRLDGKNESDISRFNKNIIRNYWSIEHYCQEKVIGWRPFLDCYIADKTP
jgi:hypothetical protein